MALVESGFANLRKQIVNGVNFGIPVVVAINSFVTDTDAEIELIKRLSLEAGAVDAVLCTHWADGGAGAAQLAEAVLEAAESESRFAFTYPLDWSIEEKIRAIARDIYGADDIELSPTARQNIDQFTAQGYDKMPICMAKTQYSLSHDPAKKVTTRRMTALFHLII